MHDPTQGTGEGEEHKVPSWSTAGTNVGSLALSVPRAAPASATARHRDRIVPGALVDCQ